MSGRREDNLYGQVEGYIEKKKGIVDILGRSKEFKANGFHLI